MPEDSSHLAVSGTISSFPGLALTPNPILPHVWGTLPAQNGTPTARIFERGNERHSLGRKGTSVVFRSTNPGTRCSSTCKDRLQRFSIIDHNVPLHRAFLRYEIATVVCLVICSFFVTRHPSTSISTLLQRPHNLIAKQVTGLATEDSVLLV
jgi:hypothetical protein